MAVSARWRLPALCLAWPFSLRGTGSRQEFGKVVVHAGHVKVGFALDRLAQIMGLMGISAGELDDGQDEVVWLVERVQNLVTRDGACWRTGDAALHLDKAQLAG